MWETANKKNNSGIETFDESGLKYLKVISKRDNNATLPEPVKDMSDFPCGGVNKQSDRSGWIVCQQQWLNSHWWAGLLHYGIYYYGRVMGISDFLF